MNVSSHNLGTADEYDDYDGGKIRADRGEGLPWTNIDGEACHMGKGSRTKNGEGKRKVVLRIHSWVGTSAMNAVHYYARLEAWGVDYHTLDSAPDDRLNVSGRGDDCKPKSSKKIEIEVTRPTTQRDIGHWLAVYGEDSPNREWQCPKLGGHERGFWERGDAIKAGKAVFDEWFEPGAWVLYLDDPDMEFDNSEEPWDDSFLASFAKPKPKARHDDWRTGWVDPYAEDEKAPAPEPEPEPAGPDLDFGKRPPERCRHCRKDRGSHKAKTEACPSGTRHSSIGYTQYHANQFFEPVKGKGT